jgi:hypothetical protein
MDAHPDILIPDCSLMKWKEISCDCEANSRETTNVRVRVLLLVSFANLLVVPKNLYNKHFNFFVV